MYQPKELKGTLRSTTAGSSILPVINKKALLKDTFPVPLKKKATLSPLTNAPKPPQINNFLFDQSSPLSLTFGTLELALTGGI